MGDPFDRGAGCESGGGVRGRRRSPMGGADDDLAVLRVDRGGLGEEAWGALDQGAGAVPGILGRDRQIDGAAIDRGRVDRGDQFDWSVAVFVVGLQGSYVSSDSE